MVRALALDPRAADTRADVYSLGCTLFYLLTGHPPFPGCTMGQKLARQLKAEPPPIEDLRADLPPGLGEVLRKCMEKEPKNRYANPAALEQALLPFFAGHVPPDQPGGSTRVSESANPSGISEPPTVRSSIWSAGTVTSRSSASRSTNPVAVSRTLMPVTTVPFVVVTTSEW